MTLTNRRIEDLISDQLQEISFEDLLEKFDIDPVEAFMILYKSGHIDGDLVEMYYDASGRK